MDAHQPADPGAPIWYIGNHLPTPDLTISAQTLENEAAQGVGHHYASRSS